MLGSHSYYRVPVYGDNICGQWHSGLRSPVRCRGQSRARYAGVVLVSLLRQAAVTAALSAVTLLIPYPSRVDPKRRDTRGPTPVDHQ